MDSLNTVLKQQAIDFGLCRQWSDEWDHDLDDYEFCDRFKRGQDFCIKHNWPTVEFIRSCFDENSLSEQGVFIDSLNSKRGKVLGNGTYVVLGDCEGTLVFPRWSAALVYARHNSRIKVKAGDFARITVRLYDEAEVEIERGENAEVRIRDKR